jgi:hypothetical protein
MIQELNLSALYWRYYASTALARYKNPLWTNRVGNVDWRDLYRYVLKDILDQNGEIRLSHMDVTAGGTILEAESAILTNARIKSETTGFTGSGYVAASNSDNTIVLTYDAQLMNKYILEFRYISKRNITEKIKGKTPLRINNKTVGEIYFWSSGSPQNWVWDKVEVDLTKGTHNISFQLPEDILLDHVNVYRR